MSAGRTRGYEVLIWVPSEYTGGLVAVQIMRFSDRNAFLWWLVHNQRAELLPDESWRPGVNVLVTVSLREPEKAQRRREARERRQGSIVPAT